MNFQLHCILAVLLLDYTSRGCSYYIKDRILHKLKRKKTNCVSLEILFISKFSTCEKRKKQWNLYQKHKNRKINFTNLVVFNCKIFLKVTAWKIPVNSVLHKIRYSCQFIEIVPKLNAAMFHVVSSYQNKL